MTKRITKIFVHLIILFSILAYSNIAYAQQKQEEKNRMFSMDLSYSQGTYTEGIIDGTFNLGLGYRYITKNKFAHSSHIFFSYSNYGGDMMVNIRDREIETYGSSYYSSSGGGLGMAYSINYQLLPKRSRFQIGIGAQVAASINLGTSNDSNFSLPHYYELGPNIEFTYFFSKKSGNAIQLGYSPMFKHRIYILESPSIQASEFYTNQFRISFIL